MITNTIFRAAKILRQDGAYSLLRKTPPFLYEKIWKYLPKSNSRVSLNGVESSHQKRIFDDILPSYLLEYVPTDDSEYEHQYIACISEVIEEGDDVVAVGGGEGISTVVSANAVGSEGSVEVFEGSGEEVKKTEATVRINGVADYTMVHHAIVSKDYSLRNSAEDADVIHPRELPESDVLSIDADGAEIPILEGLAHRPNIMIIEHHAVRTDGERVLKYQPSRVRKLIESMGYEILDEKFDSKGAYNRIEERIFVAKRCSE